MKTAVSLACYLLLFLTAASRGQENVAVLDLTASGDLASVSPLLTDRLRSELLATGKFKVLERGQMQSIIQEQGFQASGACNDDACVMQIGQMLGVDRMVAGSIGRLPCPASMNANPRVLGCGPMPRRAP
jgi:curli biogenesis system outer membrane secretion channel CsgG